MLIYNSPRNYVNKLTVIRKSVSCQFLERNKRLNLWCTKQNSRNMLVHFLQASLNCFVATAVVITTPSTLITSAINSDVLTHTYNM